MRIYALCVSYQPLTVYLYRTGFARFTHHRYDLEDINNACRLFPLDFLQPNTIFKAYFHSNRLLIFN